MLTAILVRRLHARRMAYTKTAARVASNDKRSGQDAAGTNIDIARSRLS